MSIPLASRCLARFASSRSTPVLFPEFHPHDRSRLIRFVEVRFWGTAIDGTRQVMTRRTDDRGNDRGVHQ